MINVGVGKVCITPPVGIELAGFVAREQPSIGILDDLWLRALYCAYGEERLLWLHADLLGLARETVAEIRGNLARCYRLQAHQVLISATHTHSAPATVRLRECGELDRRYVASLVAAARRAAARAIAAPQPVTLAWAEGFCNLAIDRRPPSNQSHTDGRLPVIGMYRDNGSLLALLANYPIHNVALGAANRRISADLTGAVIRDLRGDLPRDAVVLLTNGGCGNLNPPAEDSDPAICATFAERIANGIRGALLCARPVPPRLAAVREELCLPLQPLDTAAVEADYRARVGDLDPAADPVHGRICRAMASWRSEALTRVAAGTLPDNMATEVHAVRLGPVRFVALGAEVFSRLADELRAEVGPAVYVVGYANGLIGYVPPRDIYAEGGYEVDNAWKYYAVSPIAPGGHERLRDTATDLLRRLR